MNKFSPRPSVISPVSGGALPRPFFRDPSTPLGISWNVEADRSTGRRASVISAKPSKWDAPVRMGVMVPQEDTAIDFVRRSSEAFWIANSMECATTIRPNWDFESIAEIPAVIKNVKRLVEMIRAPQEATDPAWSRLKSIMAEVSRGRARTQHTQPAEAIDDPRGGWFMRCEKLYTLAKAGAALSPNVIFHPWRYYTAGRDDLTGELATHFEIREMGAEPRVIFRSNPLHGDKRDLEALAVQGKIIDHTVHAFRSINPSDNRLPMEFLFAMQKMPAGLDLFEKAIATAETTMLGAPGIRNYISEAREVIAELRRSLAVFADPENRILATIKLPQADRHAFYDGLEKSEFRSAWPWGQDQLSLMFGKTGAYLDGKSTPVRQVGVKPPGDQTGDLFDKKL